MKKLMLSILITLISVVMYGQNFKEGDFTGKTVTADGFSIGGWSWAPLVGTHTMQFKYNGNVAGTLSTAGVWTPTLGTFTTATITAGSITTATITTGNITTGNITTGNITTGNITNLVASALPTYTIAAGKATPIINADTIGVAIAGLTTNAVVILSYSAFHASPDTLPYAILHAGWLTIHGKRNFAVNYWIPSK
jgi:hypothetical protein